MNAINLTQPDADKAWLSASVKDFFSGVNWENVTAPAPELPAVTAGERNLNPDMTVGQFFGAIPWEGELEIAPPPAFDLFEAVEEEPVVDDVTLDDFFGSF
jgi:hypothetical protein